MIKNNLHIDSDFEMRVNFNLNKKGSDKSQIWLTTTIKGERIRIYTGLRIKPENWIKKSKYEVGEKANENVSSPIIKKENKAINKKLIKILEYCKEYGIKVSTSTLMDKPLEYSAQSFKSFISDKMKGLDSHGNINATIFINKYIEKKEIETRTNTGTIITSGTIYNHRHALCRLEEYCKSKKIKLVWDIFTKDFQNSFSNWMQEKQYSANTISAQFSIIKIWLKAAQEEGIEISSAYKSYPTKKYEVFNIYLTEDEIEKIYAINFNDPQISRQIGNGSQIEQARDLFVVACYTGLRFSDLKRLNDANISKDRISIKTQKTGETVIIPMFPRVKDIYKKYGNKFPSEIDKSHSITHIRTCGKLAGIDNEIKFNKTQGGKVIQMTKRKYELITNHTARRSFASNMTKKGMNRSDIMSMTGHKSESTFKNYIKLNAENHASSIERFIYDNYA